MILISLLALHMNAFAGTYADEFQNITNFREGDYDLIKGSRQCLDGLVIIREVAPQTVSIKIGARLLVDAAGPGSNVRQEGDQPGCDYDRLTEPLRPNFIQTRKLIRCEGSPRMDRYYKIEVTPNGFVTTVQNGPRTEVCTYAHATGSESE